jgi:hypothetical protein
MSTEPGPARADPADPRFAGLPFGDGTVRRFELSTPTEDSARLADGYLLATGWRVHRMGLARAAVGPNGMRWIYRWRVPPPPPPAT